MVNKTRGLYPLFFCAIIYETIKIMDRSKLKLMVRDLELLVEDIKAEVFSDVEAYAQTSVETKLPDYDEIFEDDD